jgi:hypothetical protein
LNVPNPISSSESFMVRTTNLFHSDTSGIFVILQVAATGMVVRFRDRLWPVAEVTRLLQATTGNAMNPHQGRRGRIPGGGLDSFESLAGFK